MTINLLRTVACYRNRLATNQVLDVDVAMEIIMNAWFEQRHENRRQLAKTIETHRVIENGNQRLGFARFGCQYWTAEISSLILAYVGTTTQWVLVWC